VLTVIQELQLSVLYLHPQLVDLLAAKLPRLKSLDLTFELLAVRTDPTNDNHRDHAFVGPVLVSCVPS
jgi:hypothetical protein